MGDERQSKQTVQKEEDAEGDQRTPVSERNSPQQHVRQTRSFVC